MSKKIDAVYNDDPSAGNDPSTNYKFPSTDGSTNAVALDMDQVASAVAVRIGASPPPVETEDLAQLVITIQDNTLVPNVQPITGVDYTHYNVVTDDDTEPTYPTGFSEGPLPPLLPTLAGWAAETKYVYLYDVPTTTQKTLTAPDGTSGILVTPKDTIPPIVIFTLTKSATSPITDADYVITASDSGYGVDTSKTTIYRSSTGLPITAEGISATGTLTFTAGASETLFARVYDFAGNYTDTEASVSLDDYGDTGIIEITTTDKSTVSEADGTLTIQLTLTGRSDSDEKYCTLVKRTWTTDGTGQVGAVPASGLVTFSTASDPITVDVDMTLTDQSLDDINAVEFYIDDGSAAGDALGAPDVGTADRVLIYVEGSGGAAAGAFKITANDRFVLNFDGDYSTTSSPDGKSEWEALAYSDVAGLTDDTVINDGVSPNALAPSTIVHSDATGTYLVDLTSPYDLDYPNLSALIEIPIEIESGDEGNWGIWARVCRNGTSASFYAGFDRDVALSGTSDTFCRTYDSISYPLSDNTWDYIPVSQDHTNPTQMNLTVGTHTLMLAFRQSNPEGFYINQLILTQELPATYNPSGVASGTGPNIPIAEVNSAQDTGIPVADPANPTDAFGPIYAGTIAATLTPSNGATLVSTQSVISFTIPDTTSMLLNQEGLTVTSNGGPVAGDWTITNGNTATFSYSTWAAGATIAITGTNFGSVDDGGVRKEISLGTWTYGIAASGSEDDFTHVPLPFGAMDNSWYATAKSNFTTDTDDPLDIPSLYGSLSPSSIKTVNTPIGLQAAVTNAIPGDMIILEQGLWDMSGIQIDFNNPGLSSSKIIITSEGMALGTKIKQEIVNGATAFQINTNVKHLIIAGIKFSSQSSQAINIAGGASDSLTYWADGATDIRITDCEFRQIGRITANREGLIAVGRRCHRVRIDHNIFENNYTNTVWEQDLNALTSNTKDGRFDHNYCGPAATSGFAPDVTNYEINAIRTCCYNLQPTSDPNTLTIDHNVMEMPSTSYVDAEIIEIKTNGPTIEKNIIHSTSQRISLRYCHDGSVASNYCVGTGIMVHGTGHDIINNVVDNAIESSNLPTGIASPQWGTRLDGVKYPITGDNNIHQNTVIGTLTAGIHIGATQQPGQDMRIDNVDTYNNNVTSSVGDMINFSNQSVNTNCDFTNNYYNPTGSAANGTAYAVDTPAGSPSGTGSLTITSIAT